MLTQLFTNIDARLRGWPTGVLNAALVLAALALLLIAWRGTPIQKALALAYVVFP